MVQRVDAIIIGAGFSGLLSCLKLKQIGVEKILILERGDSAGGTWAFNVYPGVACDVRSYHYLPLHYVNGFTPERTYSTGKEILDFVQLLIDQNDLARHIQYSKAVTQLQYNGGSWDILTDNGKFLCISVRSIKHKTGGEYNAKFVIVSCFVELQR